MVLIDHEADGLSRVIERLVRRLRAAAAGERVSQAAASALSRLDEDGPLGITVLARLEGVSQPSMTQLVDRLGAEGLVERRVPEDNRRTVHVHLTEAGRGLLATRRARRAERLVSGLLLLSEDDRQAIAAALPALERLAAASVDPATTAKDSQKEGTRR